MFAIKFNRIENSQINILTERLTNHDPVNGLHYLVNAVVYHYKAFERI